MKNLLIKIGKVIALFQRGSFGGEMRSLGEKTWRLLNLFLNFSGGKVVFVVGGLGDSAMYRGFNVAEELSFQGVKATILSIDDPLLFWKIKKFKIVVLVKIVDWQKGRKILQLADELNQKVLYDTDDLVFIGELFKQTEAYRNFNTWQRKQYAENGMEKILASKEVRAITTTTNFLKEKLRRFEKKVLVVENKLSQRDWQWAKEARKKYIQRLSTSDNEGGVAIGYFSGSVSHNRDFKTIEPVLRDILSKMPFVNLCLVGYLDIEDDFYRDFKSQIRQLPFVSRRKHFQNIAKVDINLIPLEMNDFCQAKSAVKFFEAGAVGVPSVAVRNQTFSEAIIDGETGFLAMEKTEWAEKLNKLIVDRELRINMGQSARKVVSEKYLTINGDKEYCDFLDNLESS